MGAPLGNSNGAKKRRLLTDALKRELTQSPQDVTAIAKKLIASAMAGEAWAMTLIHDRVDGKAPQPIVGGDEDENPISLNLAVEYVKANADPASAEA